MRIVADENVAGSVVRALQGCGVEVLRIEDLLPRGSPDARVLTHALLHDAVLLTQDKDFGQLVFEEGLPAAGIVLYRLPSQSSVQQAAALVHLLQEIDPVGLFVVLSERGVRSRPLQPRSLL